MQTIFDWVALAMFCALATLFLQRSTGPAIRGDRAIKYLPAALGCALGNYLGNHGHALGATAVLLLVAGYAVVVLKPGFAVR